MKRFLPLLLLFFFVNSAFAVGTRQRYVNSDCGNCGASGNGTTNGCVGVNAAYSCLHDAEVGERDDLVADDVQLKIECSGSQPDIVNDARVVVFDSANWTTDTTRNIVLYTASGSRHSGFLDTSKYHLYADPDVGCVSDGTFYIGSPGDVIEAGGVYIDIIGMQILVKDCITGVFDGYGGIGVGPNPNINAGIPLVTHIQDNIVAYQTTIDIPTFPFLTAGIYAGGSGGIYISNNLVTGWMNGIFNNGYDINYTASNTVVCNLPFDINGRNPWCYQNEISPGGHVNASTGISTQCGSLYDPGCDPINYDPPLPPDSGCFMPHTQRILYNNAVFNCSGCCGQNGDYEYYLGDATYDQFDHSACIYTQASNFSFDDWTSPDGPNYQFQIPNFLNNYFDWRIQNTDPFLKERAADLSADGFYAFSKDGIGTTRPQDAEWDIGFHESIGTETPIPTPAFSITPWSCPYPHFFEPCAATPTPTPTPTPEPPTGCISSQFVTQEYVPCRSTSNRFSISILDERTCNGMTGLTNLTTGLVISIRPENAATPTAYSGAQIESIPVLGTFSAPTVGKVRFREVDPFTQAGLYEIQPDNSFFGIPGVTFIDICVGGAANIPVETCLKVYINPQ